MSEADKASADEAAAQSAARRDVLDSLAPRKRLTGAEAEARSRLVARLRVALPVVIVILLGVFVLSARRSGQDDVRLNDFATAQTKKQNYTVEGAKIAGVTRDGKPYKVEFDQLTQAADNADVADLVRPKATTRGEREDTVVTAESGRIDQKSNDLKLDRDVTLTHAIAGEKYVLKAPSADVDVKGGVVTVTTGVVGSSQTGGLRADRMTAYNADGRVVLEGNVSMRIYPKKRPGAAPGDGAAAPTEGPR